MASVFAPFTKAPEFAPPSVEPERGSGLLDFPGNLLHDIHSAAVGIPGGVVHFFRNPDDTMEEIVRQTWHDWSPLFAGRPGEFFENFMEHPLGPLLDLSAFVSGGATLAGKGAAKLEKAGQGSLAVTKTRTINAPAPVTDVGKPLGQSFNMDDFIEGLDKPMASMGKPRTISYQVPRWGPDSRLGRFAAYAENREIAFDPFTGRQMSPGRLEYYDILGDRPVLFKNLPKNRPAQKWVMQQQHALGIKLSQEMPNIFGPKARGQGIAGIRAMGQQGRYEAHHLRQISRNKTALHAYMGATMALAQKIDSGNLPAISAFFEKAAQKVHANTIQYGRTHDISKPLPVDEFGDKAYTYVRAEPQFKLADTEWQGDGFKTLQRAMKDLDRKVTTSDLKKAARSAEDPMKVIIVPKHSMKAMGIEGSNSAHFLQQLYRSPTTIWKTIMLGYAPRFFMNNAVGNMTLYLLSQGGGSALRGLNDAYRQVYREDKLAKDLDALDRLQSFDYIQNHFADQLAGILEAHDMQDMFVREARSKQGLPPAKIDKLADRLRGTKWNLFGVTHKYADLFIRRAAINAKTRQIPEVMAEARRLTEAGVPVEKAFNDAAEAYYRANRQVRDEVSQATFDIMGDYVSLGPTERIIREFVPFYSWDRHILRTTKMLARDRPVLTDFLAHWGMVSTDETKEMLGGALPDFLQGVIPMWDSGGRQAVLSTHGLNPFATVPEVLDAAWAFALPGGKPIGSNLGSQINPLLQGGIEALTGTSLLTGEPKRQDGNFGFVTGSLSNILANFPEVTIARRFFEGQPQPKDPTKPFLYSKSQAEALGAYMGIPIKWLDIKRAQDLYKQQITMEGG